ncbi:MAG: M28 family peptidase, partial [Hyphomonas sp.]|nr:M28 family peptidase [Hyphomonas sp.]
RQPAPATVPAGEDVYPELEGLRIRQDLEAIVAFSHESRRTQEIGDGQLWGRITGFPSSEKTVDWSVAQFRAAGIEDVRAQEFTQDENSSFWTPLSWEVRLLADEAFGRGSTDVVLETAMPLSPSEIEGMLRAPVVYVGSGGAAIAMLADVVGKIAIQHITPQAHLVFERDPAVPRARELFRRGAVAVVNIIDQPGNERALDLSNCGGPCFNIGGRDGAFLEEVMNQAAMAGNLSRLQMQLQLRSERHTGLTARNGLAIIPGKHPSHGNEVIVINAHVDAWFDGAGDNGDGLAVQVALARYFARPENQPQRTLVFVASAGHHTPGLHGPRQFVRMNPELADNTVVALNIEHVAQRNFTPARSQFPDGYREYVADSAEAPIVAGVSNAAPFINDLFGQGVQRYGVNFVSDVSTMASGEGGGFTPL